MRLVCQEKERLLQERRKEERRQQAAGDPQYKAQAWTEISHDVIEDQIVCASAHLLRIDRRFG
jgi:hypothetical protein